MDSLPLAHPCNSCGHLTPALESVPATLAGGQQREQLVTWWPKEAPKASPRVNGSGLGRGQEDVHYLPVSVIPAAGTIFRGKTRTPWGAWDVVFIPIDGLQAHGVGVEPVSEHLERCLPSNPSSSLRAPSLRCPRCPPPGARSLEIPPLPPPTLALGLLISAFSETLRTPAAPTLLFAFFPNNNISGFQASRPLRSL